MDYELIKHKISNNITDITELDDKNKLLYLLCKKHNYIFQEFVIYYIKNPNKELKYNKEDNNYSFLFFRLTYYFHILINYIYYDLYKNIEKDDIKEIYCYFLRYSRKIEYSRYKIISDDYLDQCCKNIDYLYDIVIEKPNIYLSAYFNNLIKYFLPIPFEYTYMFSLITYRNNVSKLFKKNNVDYLDKINKIDYVHRKNLGKPKNIDMVHKEIDIHIPLKYFNSSLFKKSDKILIAIKLSNTTILYIGTNFKKINNDIYFEIEYERVRPNYEYNKFIKGMPLELLSPFWKKINKKTKSNINNVIYIQILRKIKKDYFFKVFDKIEFNKEEYKYLFHNTFIPYPLSKSVVENVPSFWFFIPWSYIRTYFADGRTCLTYKIKKDIKEIIDLTVSIISSNPFYNSNKEQKGLFYDLTKVMDYYKNKEIEKIEKINYRCLDIESKLDNIHKFCDINRTVKSSGRRRLQEIFFKSRKYTSSSIYTPEYFENLYIKLGHKFPKDYEFHKNQYYPEKRGYIYIPLYDLDKYCLEELGMNGFFFTNYTSNIDGGELLLTNSKDFLEFQEYKPTNCNVK